MIDPAQDAYEYMSERVRDAIDTRRKAEKEASLMSPPVEEAEELIPNRVWFVVSTVNGEDLDYEAYYSLARAEEAQKQVASYAPCQIVSFRTLAKWYPISSTY